MEINLKNILVVDRQTLFNHITEHMLKQGKRSTGVSGECLYRGLDSLKCAFGVCIADDEYVALVAMRRTNVFDEFPEHVDTNDLITRFHKHTMDEVMSHPNGFMVKMLQRIHDSDEPKDWPTCFENLASEQGLKYEPKSELALA